jgi:hypothetical protein
MKHERKYGFFKNNKLPSKNAGHPQPLLNFVLLLYSGVPQPAQPYTPGASW